MSGNTLLQQFVTQYLANPETSDTQKLRITYLSRFEPQTSVTWQIDANLHFAVSLHAIEKSYGIFVQAEEYLQQAVQQCVDLNLPKIRIAAMDVKYVNTLVKILQQDAPDLYTFDTDDVCYTWVYKDKLPSEVPSDATTTCSTLQAEDAHLVDKYWKYSSPGTLAYMQFAVQHRPSCGISIVTENEQMQRIAWAIVRQDGAISCLYTLPEHRGKQYAQQCITGLMHRMVQFTQNQVAPFCYIVMGNTQSERVFEKLGFTRCGQITWVLRMNK